MDILNALVLREGGEGVIPDERESNFGSEEKKQKGGGIDGCPKSCLYGGDIVRTRRP